MRYLISWFVFSLGLILMNAIDQKMEIVEVASAIYWIFAFVVSQVLIDLSNR